MGLLDDLWGLTLTSRVCISIDLNAFLYHRIVKKISCYLPPHTVWRVVVVELVGLWRARGLR